MKIYTKTGDSGETGLLGGDRISKSSLRIDAIGTADEVNAWIGVCLLENGPDIVVSRLTELQSVMFDIGAELACPPDGKFDLASVTHEDAEQLEREIDEMSSALPELKNFILPGGNPLSAKLHYLRTLVRRLERALFALHAAEPLKSEPLVYVNRLSDWIFCASRFVNHQAGISDVHWKKRER